MRPIIAIALFTLLAPSAVVAAPAAERPIVLALNPQPEPPGRAKIRRVYVKEDDSRRQLKKPKLKPENIVAPTKY